MFFTFFSLSFIHSIIHFIFIGIYQELVWVIQIYTNKVKKDKNSDFIVYVIREEKDNKQVNQMIKFNIK